MIDAAVGNRIAGANLALTTESPRWATEAAVRKALRRRKK
jgi:hypothetical protein